MAQPQMRRRRRFILAITAIVVITVILLLIASKGPTEPTYKGLTIIQWLSGPETPAKEEALVSLGTHNLQLIVHRLKYEQTKDPIFFLYSRLPDRLKQTKLLKHLCAQKYANAAAANIVIRRLGPHAAPAVPELTQLAQNGRPNEALKALMILSDIGEPAVPGILAGMANRNQKIRSFALFSLERYWHSPSAWQAITNALADPDPNTRQEAAGIIGRALN